MMKPIPNPNDYEIIPGYGTHPDYKRDLKAALEYNEKFEKAAAWWTRVLFFKSSSPEVFWKHPEYAVNQRVFHRKLAEVIEERVSKGEEVRLSTDYHLDETLTAVAEASTEKFEEIVYSFPPKACMVVNDKGVFVSWDYTDWMHPFGKIF